MDTLEHALAYLRGGISVIPISRNGSKCPVLSEWNPYRVERASEEEARRWWGHRSPPGIAAVCGPVSGGLEVIDFDREAAALFPRWQAAVEESWPGLLDRVCVVRTPRQPAGGYHAWLRCSAIPTPGSTTLASLSRAEQRVEKALAEREGRKAELKLIETRGEGGYALVPGCPPECHPNHACYVHEAGPPLASLPQLTADERDTLFICARALNRDIPAPQPTPKWQEGTSLRPGDDFDSRGWDWAQILEPHGWALASGSPSGERRWRRPGKDRGWSATTGCCSSNGADLFHVFTSSDAVFEAGKSYGKFRAFALLNAGGDLAVAAKQLARMGFGAPARGRDAVAKPPAVAPQGAVRAPRRPDPYFPFPLAALPGPLARFVDEASRALGCDPAYVALPALAVCAGAIGNSRAIELRKGWVEPSVLWTAPVGESGTLKTPAFNVALWPLYAGESERRERHRLAVVQWQRRRESEEADDAEKPILSRPFCSDVTVERLAEILQENPRGLLVAREELGGWLGSFGRYKPSQAQGDVPFWLSAYGASPITYDRKKGDNRSIHVARAALSVTGTIQPGVLARALTPEHFEAGLASRLLMALPERRRKEWTDAAVSDEVKEGYGALVAGLLRLPLRPESGQVGGPHPVPLAPEAKAAWARWYNEWAGVQFGASGDMAAAYAKLEGAAARLALLHHVVTMVDQRRDDLGEVTRESVESGVELTRWFAGEARRIYPITAESETERAGRRLIGWVAAHRGTTTVKELQQSNSREYPSTAAAEEALEGLVQAGLGRWEVRPPGPKGGRPTRDFILLEPRPDETETDETDGESPPA